MLSTIKDTIKKYNLINEGDHVLLAISGGCDSVSLLHILIHLSSDYSFNISALHVNHGLRNKESDDDENFVLNLCQGLNIPVYIYRYNARDYSQKNGFTLEEGSRKLRYNALYKCSLQIGATKIATAHNKNDSVESIILNLARGSGLSGLRGIPPVRSNIIRPLIECDRAKIEDYCAKNLIKYRFDSTNISIEFTRNKIRHLVLNDLKQVNHNIINTISESSKIFTLENSFMNSVSIEAFSDCCKCVDDSVHINIEKFLNLDEAIKARVIRIALSNINISLEDFTFKHIQNIISLCNKQSGKIISLPMGLFAQRLFNIIKVGPKIIEKQFSYSLNIGDFIHVKEKNFFISCSLTKIVKDGFTNTCTKCINYDKIIKDSFNFCSIDNSIVHPLLTIRTRASGDKIYIKNTGTQKLKNYFINKKIPASERGIALLAQGSNIICILGYYISSKYTEILDNKLYIQIWKENTL